MYYRSRKSGEQRHRSVCLQAMWGMKNHDEKEYCIAYNSLVCTANVLSRGFHRIQPPHVVESSSLQKYSMRLQEGGKVPHQIPLQAMSNESKQRNVQVQPCKGRICSNFLSMNIGIKLRGSCRSD
ncbi:unnamed protein product [Sphagnum tenellum]